MNFTNIRVFFSKHGNAKYISHLDLYRTMSRAIKRSGLPVWITEGFNPHIYLTFALPLALGIEGVQESMDLRFTDEAPTEADDNTIAQRLNAVMPCGLDVIRVATPIHKAAEIQKARYQISSNECGVVRVVDEYLSRDEIKITKKTKKNVQEIDVKPLLEWENGVLTLPAGSTLNINPWNVLADFGNINVKRTEILCEDGELFV